MSKLETLRRIASRVGEILDTDFTALHPKVISAFEHNPRCTKSGRFEVSFNNLPPAIGAGIAPSIRTIRCSECKTAKEEKI